MTPVATQSAIESRLRGELSEADRKELFRDLTDPAFRAMRQARRPLVRQSLLLRPHENRVLDTVVLALSSVVDDGQRVTKIAAMRLLLAAGLRAILLDGRAMAPGKEDRMRALLDLETP